MEIEAKYAVLDPETLAQVAELSHLAGFRITDIETRRITDTYLDTPFEDLMGAGLACRRRRSKGRSWINTKGLGACDGTIHRRAEMSVPIDEAAMTEPDLWPPGPLRELVEGLCAAQGRGPNEKLVPLFELTQDRRVRHFLDDQKNAFAELSLDVVACFGEGWQETYNELEIELLESGTELQLTQVVTALAAIPGLVPQPTSKFERGLAMAYHAAGSGSSLDLGNVQVDDTMGEATRKLIRPLFLRMQMHESGTYLGEDPEALHDMRVMTRRMRTAFRMAEPYLAPKGLESIPNGLTRTARILGAVRDMDVFRQKTEAYISETAMDRDQFVPLIRVWDVEYARRRNDMLTYLNSKRYGRFKQVFWGYLDTQLPDDTKATPVGTALPVIVNAQLEALLAQGELIGTPGAPLAAYHQLRICVKHLRYTLTFFRDVLGSGARHTLRELEALQDTLGDLQDAVVAVNHLRAAIRHGAWETPLQAAALWRTRAGTTSPAESTPHGLVAYLSAREAEIAAIVKEAPAAWRRFQKTETPQWVRDALATLTP